ncbi:acyl-CoA reductase [Desulfoplanes formicivorans]|uniref:Acyl-CoA reductase n=1 Tax=Desulfoplanes formicivorans TaxID=1592317 RepID=A0A194ADR8_9BACT|nr:acyl-CoA reductase [Desulfoplanes formicivorans]GAU08222.1 acyl-CoA reductase [Desulfoplanes formicivorans]
METMQHFFFGTFHEAPRDLDVRDGRRFFSASAMKQRVDALARIPLDDIISLLDRVGTRLTRPGRYRDRILEIMPRITGYSLPMMEKAMEALQGILCRESLEERLSCLGDRRALDGWTIYRGKAARALPLGAICHVAPGNIFLGSVDSVITGMITKNINVLKLSRHDPIFPFLFLEALLEEDPTGAIASTLAITSWSHTNADMMHLVGEEFDGILLFGGEEAVREYAAITSPTTRLLAFGPKLSWGLIRKGLKKDDLQQAIEGFAMDTALWEQKACTSCQNLFVEGRDLAHQVAHGLHQELQRLADTLPQAGMDLDEGVDIRKAREQAFWDVFKGRGLLLEGRTHSVILREGTGVIPSPLNRTIYVNTVENWKDVLKGNMPSMTDHMSTVGLAVPESLLEDTLQGLEPLGIPRFCRPGTMGVGVDAGAPHDGSYLILGLVKMLSKEDLPLERLGRTYDAPARREARLVAELNRLVNHALKSPFYKKLYADVQLPITSLEDFSRLPVLEKHHLETHCPPADTSMLTAPAGASYLFSSGGTSGTPRNLCWSVEEFKQSQRLLGQGFRALGISSGDRVANLMRAGSLYTGFLATNGGLEQTGCQILSITANQSIEETLNLVEGFRPNVAMGMTSTLVELAEQARKEQRTIRLERIFYTGEAMSESSRNLLRTVFHASRIGSLSYGAVEIGPLGYQCDQCRHDEFHLSEDWAYLEFGENGEVFATGTGRLLHPIIRYRIGDRAAWVDSPCACGRTSPKFRLLGRTDHYVRLLYNDLYMAEIDRTLAAFPGLTPVYQIIVRDGEKGLEAHLIIEGQDHQGLETEVWNALKKEAAEFKDLPDFGCHFTVSIRPPGSIERMGRTGKIRRIVDLRVAP